MNENVLIKNATKEAVVLVSGGMDSCVVTALLDSRGYELNLLHTNYGHRTEEKELQCFHAIADHYGAKRRLVVNIDYLAQIGGSSLTDKSVEVSPANLDTDQIPSSYVPFRNANLLAIATSWGEVIKSDIVAIGAVEEDSSGYPDCRAKFFEDFQRIINTGTHPETRIAIETPLIEMTKVEIVSLGLELNAPLHLTWSCYKREDIPCEECDSCALRARGFEGAGRLDPLLRR